MEKKTFIVYMPRIANVLMNEGFEVLKIIPNPKKPQYNAFVFEATQDFLKAFTRIANTSNALSVSGVIL